MDMIKNLIGLIGGGWGSAIAALGAIVLFFLLKGEWKKFQENKADKDAKDQFTKDHQKQIEDNQSAEAQAKAAKEKQDQWIQAQKSKRRKKSRKKR